MKRGTLLLLLASTPLLFLGAVWQTSRYATLAADAKRIESAQELWVDENEKLVGSISILSSKERIGSLAGELGLEKASPERRIHIVPASEAPAPSSLDPSLQARSPESEGGFGG
jgi:hypothetical protein